MRLRTRLGALELVFWFWDGQALFLTGGLIRLWLVGGSQGLVTILLPLVVSLHWILRWHVN